MLVAEGSINGSDLKDRIRIEARHDITRVWCKPRVR